MMNVFYQHTILSKTTSKNSYSIKKFIIISCIPFLFMGCTQFVITNLYDKNTTSLEEALLAESNKIRKENGLQLLVMDQKLRKIACEYSEYMAQEEFFAHTDPKNRNLSRRLSYSGIKFLLAAENLALITKGGFDTEQVIQAWLDSKEHRHNLLDGKFNQTGIGVVVNSKGHYYITHIFLQKMLR